MLFNPPGRLALEVYILPLDLSPENWPHSCFHFCLIKMVSRCLCKDGQICNSSGNNNNSDNNDNIMAVPASSVCLCTFVEMFWEIVQGHSL